MRNLYVAFLLLAHQGLYAQENWDLETKNTWQTESIQPKISRHLTRIGEILYRQIAENNLHFIDYSMIRTSAAVQLGSDDNWSTAGFPNPINPDNPYDMLSAFYRDSSHIPYSGLVFFVDSLHIDPDLLYRQLDYLDSIQYQYASKFLGWMDVTLLDKVLNEEELQLFLGYRQQLKSELGENDVSMDWMFLSYKPQTAKLFGMESSKMLTNHNLSLFKHVFWRTSKADIEIDDFGTFFFKDYKFSEAYDSITTKIFGYEEVIVPNPDNPTDPYDLIFQIVTSTMLGEALQMIHVKKMGNDYDIVGYVQSVNTKDATTGYMEVVRTSRTRWHATYFSYSSIKHLLQPHDRIVLEALLQEITN